jgi:rhodanese-related sulfurtransferase
MTVVRTLGFTALALGAAAPFAGSPYAAGRSDAAALAKVISEGGDHVSALQLAGWIRARKPGLRVIDVRSPQEFAAFSIPSAENIPLDALVHTTFGKNDTVVLYSEGGAHAGQAWVLLQLQGVKRAYFIAGGLADWRDEVMAPSLPTDATTAQIKAFAPIAALSAYFGGAVQTGPAGSAPTQIGQTQLAMAGAAADLAAIRRRGC